MKWYSHYQKIKLKNRWTNQESRIEAIIRDIKNNNDWTKRLLENKDLGWGELPLLDTCPNRFKLPNESASRDLRGISLRNVNFSGNRDLNNICFDLSVFDDLIFDDSALNGSSFRYVKFGHQCSLQRIEATNSDFRYADLSRVSLKNANFVDSKLHCANLEDSDLEQTTFKNIEFNEFQNERLIWSVIGLFKGQASSSTIIGGRKQNSNNLSDSTDPNIKEYCDYCNHLIQFQNSSPKLSKFMRLFAVYGYSIHRIFFWTFLLWITFGSIYSAFPLVENFENTWFGKILTACAPEFNGSYLNLTEDFFTPFYISITNMTTLGDGRWYPTNFWAQLYVGLQAILGYFLLAFSVSVFVIRSYLGLKR